MRDLARILEALLFSTDRPLVVTELARAAGSEEEETSEALERLNNEYSRLGSAVELRQVAGGWQMVTRSEYAPWIARMGRSRPSARLSQAALETLAIIAYRQPLTKPEVEGVRGVECGGVLRTLMERRMIELGPRKETAGRPFTYITTQEFLVHFGLVSLADMPRIEEVDTLIGREEGLFPPVQSGEDE